MDDTVDPRYHEGIRLFDAEEFFACHDVFEDLWTETLDDRREFYQGLIHAAVALHHFEERNLGGAMRMYRSARRYLTPYQPTTMGLRVDLFLDSFRECFAELLDARDGYPDGLELDRSRLPKLSPLLQETD
ncbi:DUF309 domain-containing protein [Maioricimonas sp. JC845]|uniref:DUF309 domain-containing protein n=1 Tax=Maioricimonas sp. JC845 TaxID=3232138 RepID=UPI0034582A95